ncbi:hypothetical protein [Streptomyces sp. NPDC005890]|uniref:hypothetical protein n=1 Tax=Streptomyces sp. NPDC005890 TaxID=3154568 RepID=UPI0033DA2509
MEHRPFIGIVVQAVVDEPGAGAEEFCVAQPGKFPSQLRIGTDEDSRELVDRLRAGLDRRVLGQFVHPGDLHWPIARLGLGARPPAQHRPGRVLGVERVGLAAPTAVGPVEPIHIENVHALGQQIT